MSDLIKRLRHIVETVSGRVPISVIHVCHQSANEIDRLTRELSAANIGVNVLQGQLTITRGELAAAKGEIEGLKKDAAIARFDCFSDNEGDSWFHESPADMDILTSLTNCQLGDEFELLSGWNSVRARYRISKVDGDDIEVECISHPNLY